jgi:acyl carrier protein
MAADAVYQFKAMFPHIAITNAYGPTETSIGVIFNEVSSQYANPIPIGRPIPNVQAVILDRHLNLVPVGIAGELCLGGACVGLGYLNDPELTARAFVANPFSELDCPTLYRTGDLARFRADGIIEFLGRIDQQVKIRGMRIELDEIESVLGEHPAVRQVVVVAREDTPGDKRLVAYVVPTDAAFTEGERLRAFLRERMPDYMVPAAYVMLERLPLTPNGKLDRRALPAPQHDRTSLADSYVAPRDGLEEQVAGVWREVLKLDQVGATDNFFELGGHSLLAAQVVARLAKLLKVELPLRRMFDAPTVAELAEDLARLGRQPDESAFERILREVQALTDEEASSQLDGSSSAVVNP